MHGHFQLKFGHVFQEYTGQVHKNGSSQIIFQQCNVSCT